MKGDLLMGKIYSYYTRTEIGSKVVYLHTTMSPPVREFDDTGYEGIVIHLFTEEQMEKQAKDRMIRCLGPQTCFRGFWCKSRAFVALTDGIYTYVKAVSFKELLDFSFTKHKNVKMHSFRFIKSHK